MPLVTSFDPFTTKEIIDLPELNLDKINPWAGFHLDVEPQNALLVLAEPEEPKLSHLHTEVLKLDSLDDPVDLEPALHSSAPSSDDDDDTAQSEKATTEEEQDFWKTPNLLRAEQENRLVTWDDFTQAQHDKSVSVFTSEAGPVAFDALLRACLTTTHNAETKYAKPDVFINSLFDLGLGRSSVFFSWNEQSQRFDALFENYTMSGISQDTLKHTVNQYLDDGARFRRLRRLGHLQGCRNSLRIAFQTTINSIVDIVEDSVECSRSSVRSLLQLRSLYLRPALVLGILDRLAKDVSSISNGKDLVAATLEFADNIVAEEPEIEEIIHILVSRLIEPVLGAIEAEVGLNARNRIRHQQYIEAVTAILPSSTLELYHRTRDTLTILQEHGQDFLLLQKNQKNKPQLRFLTSFEATTKLCQEAFVYEQTFKGLILAQDGADMQDPVGPSTSIITPDNTSSGGHPFSFEADLFCELHTEGDVTDIVHANGREPLRLAVLETLGPEAKVSTNKISSSRYAVNASVTPLLRAQHRLLSYSALQVLFKNHNFVPHVKVLGRFQLLNDGTFVSKLSTALFDSNECSGESRRISSTKTGLRLQSREAWPPASSELRLALMGILSESMSHIKDNRLLDSVSFAIRDLSDEDLEKCRDIDSIYALDFLRLNYKPPSSIIEAIITLSSVEKYDQIFNQLLRLLRVQALAESMLRDANARHTKPVLENGEHMFKVRAQQFMGVLADYYHNSVVKTFWLAFETRISDIALRLEQGDYSGTLELAQGLDHLREMHEEVLDNLIRGLLLKRKQSEAKGIIDRLFEVILRFAALTSRGVKEGRAKQRNDVDEVTSTTIPRLHKDFEMHMKALVRWLKIEITKTDDGSADMLEQLLLKLDWNGYWSKQG